MIRVLDLDKTLDFFINKLGLIETRRHEHEKGRFTLIFLATEKGAPEIELTHNWNESKPYTTGRSFGHLAFEVDDIYKVCEGLSAKGVVINRPPRDGWMAFVKSPDGISIELLQKDQPLPPKEPWISAPNIGEW